MPFDSINSLLPRTYEGGTLYGHIAYARYMCMQPQKDNNPIKSDSSTTTIAKRNESNNLF